MGKKPGKDRKKEPSHGNRNQATRLVALALESGAHFYTDDRHQVVLDVDGQGQRVAGMLSSDVETWLGGLMFDTERAIPGRDAVKRALSTLAIIVSKDAKPVSQEISDRMAANAAIRREAREDSTQRRSQASRLVDLAMDRGIELFRDELGEPYAVLSLDRWEIWPVTSKAVKRWLTHILWKEEAKAPSGETIASAVNLLSSMAVFDGEEHELYVRVAWHEGALYYDLGDWRAVRITPEGWEVVDRPPILLTCPR